MFYPSFLLFPMELVGTVAFSASGAAMAIRKGMDLFGVCVLGVITAVGGGMMRDIILGMVPSALLSPVYVMTACLTALALFLGFSVCQCGLQGNLKTLSDQILLLMDAVGLGIFTVVGVNTGIQHGYTHELFLLVFLGAHELFLLVFLGTLTGVGGGLLRDILAGEPPSILVRHIYACASIGGALSYIWAGRHLGSLPALILSPALVVLIRILAARYRWNLPRISLHP